MRLAKAGQKKKRSEERLVVLFLLFHLLAKLRHLLRRFCTEEMFGFASIDFRSNWSYAKDISKKLFQDLSTTEYRLGKSRSFLREAKEAIVVFDHESLLFQALEVGRGTSCGDFQKFGHVCDS